MIQVWESLCRKFDSVEDLTLRISAARSRHEMTNLERQGPMAIRSCEDRFVHF